MIILFLLVKQELYRSHHTGQLALEYFLALCKLWELSTLQISDSCLALWNLSLHILSLVFSNRLKRMPLKIAGAIFSPHNCLLTDNVLKIPDTSDFLNSDFCPLSSGSAILYQGSPSCAMVQKVTLGRKLRKLQDSFVHILFSFLRDHSPILTIV